MIVITKEQIRTLLNNNSTPVLQITHALKKYFLQPENKNVLLNNFRRYYLNEEEKNIIKWFVEDYEELVSNTALCRTKYASQMLLKTVWQMLPELQIELIKNIKESIILEEPDKKQLSKEERLQKQAAIMREAKAKKRAEKLEIEAKLKKAEEAKKQNNKEKPKQKFSEEINERLEWLKKL